MEFLDNYLNNLSEQPSTYYHNFSQALFDEYFYDNMNIKQIKEQAYPFTDVYTEYDCVIDTVSDISTNTNKVSGDYINILFKDIDHTLNHRGQKYLYKPDGINENTYLCYDKLQPLSIVPDFKAIRCNNHLTIMLSDGTIVKEPCSIGYEMSATNNGITKDGTIAQRRLVCLVQGNSNTKDIKLNQRFILQHRQAFKITEMNVLNQEDAVSEDVTLYTFYIEWSSILPTDNLELNLADYYQSNYTLKINSSDLSLSQGATGQLTAIVTLNDSIVTNIPLKWFTSDSNVITVDSLGNYQVLGLDGSTSLITCSIDTHSEIYDTINVNVVAIPSTTKELIINPNTAIRLTQGQSQVVDYGVYIGNVLQSDVVTVTPSGAGASCYTLTYGTNKVTVKNITKSTTPLTLTFTSGALSRTSTITLAGLV